MSGVFGFVNAQGYATTAGVAERMGAQMLHLAHLRVVTSKPAPDVALGRLTIGLLNQGPAAAISPCGQVHLLLCGEFYHHAWQRRALELAAALPAGHDDAAFALAAYMQGGVAGITALEGAFTIAIWDARQHELLLINDRYGLYPHYYAQAASGLAFAPEIKGVLAAPGISRQLHETALAEYINYQQLLGNKTWFSAIQVLPPATVLRYRPGVPALHLEQYWDWDRVPHEPGISFDEAVAEAIRLFERGVRAMAAPPLRPGVFLSGGLDGRMILGCLDGGSPVPTVTFGAPGCRDVRYAARLARRAGSPHRWFAFSNGRWVLEHYALHLALTEGMHSWIHAHGISMLADVRSLFDVNLSGWDGATMMGGQAVSDDYAEDRYFRYPPDEAALVQRMDEALRGYLTWPGLTPTEANALLDAPNGQRLRHLAFESLASEVARTRHYPSDRRVDYLLIVQDLRRSLQNQIVTQRSHIEVRCPYFDYQFATFIYSLPDQIRCNPAFRRAFITRRMPHLALVPYDKDDRLPHEQQLLRGGHSLFKRSMSWFNRHVLPLFPEYPRLYADYENYLRHEVHDWAAALLFDQRTLERGLYNPAALAALWQRHQSGTELWTIGKLAPLMTLELVLRNLYDPASQEEIISQPCVSSS